MDYYDNDIDREVDDILSQLKNQTTPKTNDDFVAKKINKDEMEEFIINNAAAVVQKASNLLDSFGTIAANSADPDMVNSVSGLVRSITSAIDSLTKLKIAEDKNNTQKEIAQMSVKKDNDESKPNGLMMTRDDVIKFLSNEVAKED